MTRFRVVLLLASAFGCVPESQTPYSGIASEALEARLEVPGGCLGQTILTDTVLSRFFQETVFLRGRCIAEHGDSVAATVGIHHQVGVFLLDSPTDVAFMVRQEPVQSLDSTNAVDYAAEVMRFMGRLPYGSQLVMDGEELARVVESQHIIAGPTRATGFLGTVGPGFDVRLVSSGPDGLRSIGVLLGPDGSVTTYGERIYEPELDGE